MAKGYLLDANAQSAFDNLHTPTSCIYGLNDSQNGFDLLKLLRALQRWLSLLVHAAPAMQKTSKPSTKLHLANVKHTKDPFCPSPHASEGQHLPHC